MQKMQPKINELQKKYANDQQKLQQKQMELFRNEHYNPMSGCLPMLIQLPILWIMFAAMRSLANEQMARQIIQYVCGETPQLSGWLWVKNVWSSDSLFAAIVPTLDNLRQVEPATWSAVIASLPQETIQTLIANIPNYTEGMLTVATSAQAQTLAQALYAAAELQPAYQAAMEMSVSNLNILFLFTVNIYKNYNGLLILPALAAITQVIMTKFTQQAQPAQNSGNNAQAAQTQSMNTFMKYLFPLMSIWFCLISSASFAIYWVTSNIVAGISNYAISKYYDNIVKPAMFIYGVKNNVICLGKSVTLEAYIGLYGGSCFGPIDGASECQQIYGRIECQEFHTYKQDASFAIAGYDNPVGDFAMPYCPQPTSEDTMPKKRIAKSKYSVADITYYY